MSNFLLLAGVLHLLVALLAQILYILFTGHRLN